MMAPTSGTMDEPGPILYFDGVCNLCCGAVRFVIARDPRATVRYASLQSGFAQERVPSLGVSGDNLDSIVLVEGGTVSIRSTAALRLCRHMRGFWPLMRILLIVPRPLRDAAYDCVARNRYRWFGKQEACLLPTPEVRARFLND